MSYINTAGQKIFARQTISWTLLLIGLIFATILFPNKVSANHDPITLNPDPGNTILPEARDALVNCRHFNRSPALAQWISDAGDFQSREITVTDPTAPIQLRFHDVGAICWPNNAVDHTSRRVVGSSVSPSGSLSGINDQETHLAWSDFNDVGAYRAQGITFTLSPPSTGFTTNNYTITIESKAINHFVAGPYAFLCVSNDPTPINPGSQDNYGPCPTLEIQFTVRVVVEPPPSNCTMSGAPASIGPGQTFSVSLNFTNNSGHSWSGHQVGSSMPRNNTTWGGSRWSLPAIANGASGNTSVNLTAPFAPGTYTLAFEVIQEFNHWEPGTLCSASVVVASSTCPSQPNPPHHTVTLSGHYAEPYPGEAGPYGAEHIQRITHRTRYTSHEDTSSGGDRVLPTLISQTEGNPGNVRLDYQPYINEYPFDRNQAQVNYLETVRRHRYTYTGSEVWHYHPNWQTIWFQWGNEPGSWITYDAGGEWHFHGWAPVYQGETQFTENHTVQAPLMQPCWLRTYDATEPTFGTPGLSPDRESPNQATLSSSTINLQFGVTQPGRGRTNMRLASRANNLPYTVHYQIVRSGNATPTSGSPGWLPNTSGNVTVTANGTAQNATGSNSIGTASIAVSVEATPSDMRVGDRVCWRVTLNEERGNINVDGGRSSASGSISGVGCSLPVVNWPYLKVFGNDVVAGGRFGGTCSTSSNGTVRVNARTGQFVGSSVQYAVFALRTINGFTSASLRSGSASDAKAPFGLTFANTTGGYGGNYTASDGMTCLPDYFASRPANRQSIGQGAVRNELENPARRNSNPTQIEYFDISGGNVTLPQAINVTSGMRKVFYINGTLTITNNITLQSAWANREEIPYVMFIARDIVINRGVTQLDGVYVAQEGAISTCDTRSFQGCQQPLVVNGALIADRINFWRTRGSLRNARTNEGRPGTLVGNCSVPFLSAPMPSTLAGTPGGTSCAAEVINFSPEIFLVLSQLLTPQDNFKYDSYVTLPPNL